MLEYPTFFHISSKNPDDADIANRKHYSAPEGALTFLVYLLYGTYIYIYIERERDRASYCQWFNACQVRDLSQKNTVTW